MYDIKITRAVARKLVDLLDPPEDAHPLVAKAIGDLIDALDSAQGDTPATFEIEVTGTNMDLPE